MSELWQIKSKPYIGWSENPNWKTIGETGCNR